jgi:hypothetical protein
MTSVRITPVSRGVIHAAALPRDHIRLRLKPRAHATGVVDGGWWPRSRDLAAEVPALLAVLAVRLGSVEGVSYHLDDWGPTPRRIEVGGARVRLAGYRSQHRDTIDVYSRGQRVTLLVVAPEASALVAGAALRAAGRRANADDVGALLLAHQAYSADDAGDQRWEMDGGLVRSE